jgi:hypothetical protein
LAADAEIFSAFGSFDLDDLERDLDTELNQHLRPRRNTKQVWKSVDEIDTDLRAAVSAAIGRHSPLLKWDSWAQPYGLRATAARLLSTGQPCP